VRFGSRVVVAGALLAATTCCGAEQERTSPPPPAETASSDQGRDVGSQDDGAQLHLRPGENADLAIRDPSAPDPVVVGDAVTLVEVDSARATGAREFEIRAVRPGEASIHAMERGRRFTIKVLVTDG
jgi:hypothetical protein